MTLRVRPCTKQTADGRQRKATQFLPAAELIRQQARTEEDVADALVTLCVPAGIAAADVICCKDLRSHAIGEDHTQAVSLVKTVRHGGPKLAADLGALLRMKTKAAYGEEPVSAAERTRAYRRALQLVTAARSWV